MEKELTVLPTSRILVPVVALTLYAISSGYLMSIIPLMLTQYGISAATASWLASAFYAGLLIGAVFAEGVVSHLGHRKAFIVCLFTFIATVVCLPLLPSQVAWLIARFVAGLAVAGVFVTVESWLMAGDEANRAKRLSFYMIALYGGSAFGQFGIAVFGVEGMVPFFVIASLLTMAIMVLVFVRSEQPATEADASLTLKQMTKLNHAAIIGCIISGLTLGAIYGLMPVELSQRNIANDNIAILMALVILGGMAVQPLVTIMSKKFKRIILMLMFSLLGVFSIGLTLLTDDVFVLAIALVGLGMATFALYPIAISLGCQQLDEKYMVSVAQVMLFAYGIGSVAGPALAGYFISQPHGLFAYLFIMLLATSIYMLIASIENKSQIQAAK